MTKIYQTEEVKVFKQTPGKIYCLNPAFERNLPDVKNKTLLDIGCGDGFYYTMCHQKGYKYVGLDISEAMIKKAKTEFPDGEFITGSCFDLTKIFGKARVDVVISSMLFPEFDKLELFKTALNEVFLVLKPGGIFLLGTAHPAFDMYLRKYLFNLDYVEADYHSYFDTGKLFKVKKILDSTVFHDHHWTLENYINELISSGFEIAFVDECKIVDRAKEEVDNYEERIKLPSFILFKAIKIIS